MSETLREARGRLEWYLDEIASLHPNDYRHELDAVIDAAAPEISDAMVRQITSYLNRYGGVPLATHQVDNALRAALADRGRNV